MIERFLSRFRLVFLFSFFVFFMLLFHIGLSAVVVYVLLQLGLLGTPAPYIGMMILVFASISIGLVVTILGTKLMLNPIKEMLTAMKKLAGGDFTVRIHPSKISRIKELREFSEEFNAAAKELGSIEMLRSDFVNNFSHEFKTPIVSVKGFAKLIKKQTLTDEEREEYLDIIIAESDRLADLATNILELTRLENQTIITEKTDFDLTEQIRRALLMMESKWSERNLQLEMDLEEVSFRGNAELLHQVWINLLDNAVKFSPQDGTLEITLQTVGSAVIFTVRDHGCGMDPDTQTHIFDKFYQGSPAQAVEGNGLGMAVVHKVVEMHNGKIAVASQLESGTQVTVTLPHQSGEL